MPKATKSRPKPKKTIAAAEVAPKIKRTPAPPERKPLTADDLQFCQYYCVHGNQAEAYRSVWTDDKNPHTAATRLMRRPEVKSHIRNILELMEKKAAERSAAAITLSLETANTRLGEILGTRRVSRGEMLTRHTKQIILNGVEPKYDEGGNVVGLEKTEEFEATLDQGAPVEDSDLLKAVDLTYKRLGGYPSTKAADDPQPQSVFLYQPQWKIERQPRQIEAEVNG